MIPWECNRRDGLVGSIILQLVGVGGGKECGSQRRGMIGLTLNVVSPL